MARPPASTTGIVPSFGSFQVKAATNRHGYSTATILLGSKDCRTDGSIIAVEKKMPRRELKAAVVPSARADADADAGGGGGIVEVRIMIYVEKRAVAVCVFDRMSDDGRAHHHHHHHHGGCSHHGDLFNEHPQWVYAAGDIATIDEIEKVLKAPLEYGLSKRTVYSRNGGDIGEKWSEGPVQGRPDICSSCGKKGLHVGAAAEFQLMGGGIDDNDPIMRVCSRCCRESYCSRSCQKAHWRKHKKKCKDRAYFDGAVRWGVAAITGGLTTDPAEANAIRDVCNQFDYLLFEDGAPPSLACCRLSCGAQCALTAMCLRIGRRFHKVKGFADVKEAMAVLRGETDYVDCYLGFPPCRNTPIFRGMYKEEMTKLERSILALRPAVRAELIHWFFEKLQCDQHLTMVDSQHLPLTREEMFPVHFALMDYSRLVHGKFDDRVYCGIHGTIDLEQKEEDDDNDEEDYSDFGTSFANFAKEAILARNNPSYEQDIRCVISQVDYCSRATAVDALVECNGDIVVATMKIIEDRRKNESNDLDSYEDVD